MKTEKIDTHANPHHDRSTFNEGELAKLKPVDVRNAVDEIIAYSSDDEKAHDLEDDLYERVLRAIASGARYPRALARAALLTKELKFKRWCA
jgi:hypothetical protein